MRRPHVLVIGTSVDAHVAAVLDRLPANLRVCRLDVDRYPRSLQLTVRPGGQPRVTLGDGDDRFQLDRVPVAWFRRLGQPGLDERVRADQRAFALGEVEQTLAGALSVLEPSSWLNEYWATRRAAVKLWQFQVIASLGIPHAPVIVSNAPDLVGDWMRSTGQAVYKSLHSPLFDAGDEGSPRRFVFTSPVEVEDLADDGDHSAASISLTPCQFQRRLDPVYELRVTSVDRRHFAARIDHGPWPPKEPSDWRAHPEKVKWRSYELPAEVATQLDSLMDALSLDFGASDWIVDRDGEHMLLEINPHGAWLWLEDELPNLGISQAIAAALTERARSGRH